MIPKKQRVKTKDIHIRITQDRQTKLHSICKATNKTITQIIEQHLEQLETQYNDIF
jgi:predicted DNA-binding protein